MAAHDSIREDLVERIGKIFAPVLLADPAHLGASMSSIVDTSVRATVYLMLHAASVHLDPEVNVELVDEIRSTLARIEEFDEGRWAA